MQLTVEDLIKMLSNMEPNSRVYIATSEDGGEHVAKGYLSKDDIRIVDGSDDYFNDLGSLQAGEQVLEIDFYN